MTASDRRSPCGERGLKYRRGERYRHKAGRSPCGERGLKSCLRGACQDSFGRSPCGERGLKLTDGQDMLPPDVAPHAGSVD